MQREYLGTKVYMASHPKMRSLFRSDARPTDFGDKVWNSTLTLMRYLDGRTFGRVIDIGCGWGILGIHLARNSGTRVTCVDADPKLQKVVELHSKLNDVRVSFKTANFDALPVNCEIVMFPPKEAEIMELFCRCLPYATPANRACFRLIISDVMRRR